MWKNIYINDTKYYYVRWEIDSAQADFSPGHLFLFLEINF